MIAPSNFMQGVSIPASLLQSPRNIPLQEVSCNVIPSMVTGLNPPLLYYEGRSVNHHASHHAGDYFHVHLDVYKHSLRQPDYTDKATRLQSFKYWDGPLPPAELVDAGFYMIAPRDTVRCYSCKVVVRNWRKGDSPIDVHCLYSPNCNFVKNCIQKLIEVNDDGMASRDAGGVTNHQLNNERLVIKNRVKEEGASIHSVGPEIEQPTADKAPTPQVINHLIAGINYPPSQRSVSTYGHVIKASSTKLSEDILDSPPWEEIIFVSWSLFM